MFSLREENEFKKQISKQTKNNTPIETVPPPLNLQRKCDKHTIQMYYLTCTAI